MSTVINEPIQVVAMFDRGTVRPVWFVWQRRRYEPCTVTFHWRTKDGTDALLHLSVTNGTNCFELVLNQATLIWRLASIEEAVA